MTDQWDAPLAPGACPWCSASNPPEARQCGTCGAAIAQRDDLGGVVVPGVTGVDPNLLGTPRSLASPMLRSQGTMGALNAVSHVNATLGLAAAAAILGQDTVKGMLGMKDADMARVGKPSEAALLAAEKLERERAAAAEDGEVPREGSGAPSGAGPVAPAIDPWADLPTPSATESGTVAPWADLPTPNPTESGTPDPWADLPTPSATESGTPDPWADLPTPNATESGEADPWADLPTPSATESGEADPWADLPTPSATESGTPDPWADLPERASPDVGAVDPWADLPEPGTSGADTAAEPNPAGQADGAT